MSSAGSVVRISELLTPAAIVDLDRLERNCARMGERMAALGVRLRPHVKTHKTIEGALLQCGGKPGPITVSTLAEARFFLAAGFTDITYAVPIAPAKLPAVIDLIRRGARLHLLADHEAAVAEAARCAAESGVKLSLYLKVDCGTHRAGVDPAGEESVALARRIAGTAGLELAGVLTHAGHAYACRDRAAIAAVAGQERDVTVAFASRLRAAGVEVGEVSVGSTPTMSVVDELTGVSEARPGNYVFFDHFQATIGSCALDDCAFSVLATVIGSYPEQRRLLLDAGALALSRDPGARHVDGRIGFGAILPLAGGGPLPGLRITALSQEHGEVEADTADTVAALPIGVHLRIVPNHSCLAAALFDRYHVVRGSEVVAEWHPVRGWS